MPAPSCHLLLALLALLLPASAAQLPNCQAAEFLRILPLVPEEAYSIDLQSLFTGYNLEFSADIDPDLEPYVRLGEKRRMLNESFPEVPLLGMVNYHLSRVDNSWGAQFIVLTARGDRSVVHFGILADNVSVPVINNFVTVESLANTTCYDAVLLAESNLILVDCAQKRTLNNSRGQLYDNLLYYFRISDGAKVKEVRTEMFAPFQQMARRSLQLSADDLLSGHTLLLRTYFAEGLSPPAKHNTYLEVLMLQDPLNPWILGLIDRTFLGLSQLWISDVQIYLGHIYLLDELRGVHRVYISGSEDLQYQGYYQARGFTRLAVFSPNLDNRMELALANSHSVLEVDWTEVDAPRLINRYSLMPDSSVAQLFLNDRFIFVRSSSPGDNGKVLNYTWTFIRGDRSFSRAFAVMVHPSDSTFVDFNPQMSYLMVIGEESISSYAYDDPSFILSLDHNPQLLDTLRSFTLSATSRDPSGAGSNVTCSLQVNFTLLDPGNRTMWVVGDGPPSRYSANFPGVVRIELGAYIMGPDVAYNIRETQKGQLAAKVYQLEQLDLFWDSTPPSLEDASFLKTETFAGSGSGNDSLWVYTQDGLNRLSISLCRPGHEALEVDCQVVRSKKLEGAVSYWATSVARVAGSEQEQHVAVLATEDQYNVFWIEEVSSGREVVEVQLRNGFLGNLSSLSATGNYLFTVLRHIKRVDVYLMDMCLDDSCIPICSLNHLSMYKLGVRYFAPRAVHSSPFHPDLLFIQTDERIIAVDLSKECVPRVLATIKVVDKPMTSFGFEVNAAFLVVTVGPGTVQEYDLSRVYLGEVRATKQYPMYGYSLSHAFEFDISDYGNCVYLPAVSQAGHHNVMVYRSGLPAIGSLYNRLDPLVSIDPLETQKVLVDASGYRVDYVSVASHKHLSIFRQYEKPEAEIVNPKDDYQFYLEYSNSGEAAALQLVDVAIINLPTSIAVSPFLNDIMNTKDLFYSGEGRLSEVDDSNWYQGNVLFIRPTCKDCPDKVKVNNHIQLETTSRLIPNLTSYAYSSTGGELLAQRMLLSLKTNGSIDQMIPFGTSFKNRCLRVALGSMLTVAGCWQDGQVQLQVLSRVGHKPFAFQPQRTNVLGMAGLQVSHELVMVVDTEEDSYGRGRKGGLLLMAESGDLDNEEPLSQLEYIDGDDFGMRELGDIFINNAELTYNRERDVYLLYVTEKQRGLLIMEFSVVSGRSDITIRRTHFVELKPLIQQLNETLPYDAVFQAVALKSSRNEGQLRVDRLLITTGHYHTLQVAISFDADSNLLSTVIERLYLRYSYYEVSNQIKEVDGLFMIQQSLPKQFESETMNQQLYTVYSTEGDFNGTVERRGLIGALPLADDTPHQFDFNRTLSDDGHSTPRVGVAVVEQDGQLVTASLHSNLSLLTTELLDTQIIYLDLVNDFSTEKIRVLVNGRSPYPEWKLITIIIFSVLGGVLLLGIALLGVRKLRESQGLAEQRETLVTDQDVM